MSAAVALPRLIRKLQCSSETCAPPTIEPAAAGGVDQLPGLVPGGFLKVEPPVRLLIGCVASRDSVILSISAAIAARSPGAPWNSACGEDEILRRAAMAVGVVHVGIAQNVDAALRGRRARASTSTSLVSPP